MPPAKTIPAPNNRTVNIQTPEVANTPSVVITSAVGALTAVEPLVLAGIQTAMMPVGSRWALRIIPDVFANQVLYWINMGAEAAVDVGEPFWSYEGVFPIQPIAGKQGLSIIKDSRTDFACKIYLHRKDQ